MKNPRRRKLRSYLTAAEVGKMLGVTSTRVRQLSDEERLPPPAMVGERVQVWRRDDIDAYRDPRPTTVRSALLAPASSSLRRTMDQVVLVPGRQPTAPGDSMVAVHVRAWSGAAPEGARTVVVIGALQGERDILSNEVEELVDAVSSILRVDPVATVWVTYRPKTEGSQPDLTNVVLFVPSVPGPRSLVDPQWHAITIDEIETLVGAPVECYPRPAYTADTITRWQQGHGRIVDVEYDHNNEARWHDALKVMHECPRRHKRGTTARQAADVLAGHILTEDQTNAAFLEAGGQLPWDDGTTRLDPSTRPTTFAARLLPWQRSPADNERLAAYTANLPPVDQLADLLCQLRLWETDVDRFAISPDPTLHETLSVTIGLVRHLLTNDRSGMAHRAINEDYPEFAIAHKQLTGPYDHRYLETVNWTDHQRDDRLARQLRHALFAGNDKTIPIAWGADPKGRLVAKRTNSEFNDWYAIAWPLHPHPIPPDAHIVAAQSDAVYIAESDGSIDLLPVGPPPPYWSSPTTPHPGPSWAYGYGGGGPHALVESILANLIPTLGPPHNALRDWVSDQVFHTDPEHLDIPISAIHRRFPPATPIQSGGGS